MINVSTSTCSPAALRTSIRFAAALFLLALTLAPVTAAAQPRPGLIAAYGFDEASGAVATDATGRGNTGTISGATRSPAGRFGGALLFDGVNDWVTVPHAAALALSTGLTIEAWVNPSAAGGTAAIAFKERSPDLSYALYAYNGSTRPAGRATVGTRAVVAQSGSALAASAWTHLAVTFDGANLRLYVNGTLARTTARSGSLAAGTGPLRFGGHALRSEFFAGRIDEVRIYDRALSAAEIQGDMTQPITAADTVAPAVAIDSPAPGATVAGIVTVAVTATDAQGVAGVQVLVDGSAVGAEDTAAPYGVAWDTTTVANGTHTIAARARDAAGNTATTPARSVQVLNQAAPPPGPRGPVAAYSFDEGVGSSAGDASGSGNVGALSGPAWTAAGRFGGALSFDGLDDVVTVPHSSSLATGDALTLEAWVYPSSTAGWRTVAMKEIPGELAYAIYGSNDAGRPSGWIAAGATPVSVADSAALPVNTWTHLAMTFDGATLRLFRNGVLQASRAAAGPLVSSTQPLRIGGNGVWGEYFAGRIDDVRVYDRALTAAEVQVDMNTPVAATTPPADTTAPTVTVTAPVQGATVSGSVVVTAAAADNVGVAGVQFLLDGAPLGSEDASAPFSVTWSAAAAANGTHALAARARDAAGNTATSSAITVQVQNDPAPVIAGVTAQPLSATAARIAWTTSEPATTQVEYGPTIAYGSSSVLDSSLTATHTVDLAGLSPATTYHVRARSADAAGQETVSGDVVFSTPAAPAAGLVAAYGFEEGTGLVAADTSPSANAGTISGATWTTAGRFGAALVFDGVNDVVTIADAPSLDLSSALTMEAWLRPAGGARWQTVVMKEIPNELAYALYSSEDSGRPSAWLRAGGSSSSLAGPAALAAGTWVHVAVTYDGATLRMYRDGVQVASRALGGTLATSANPLRIGGNLVWGEYFSGTIDEVRIYNRALSAAEIMVDMGTPVGTATPPPPPPVDTVPPGVSLTAPAAGATLAATVTVSATATDNTGVAGVQFLLNGTPLGPEDATSPYSVSWNTASATNGTHALSARARDAAGNVTTSAARSVTVSNSTAPPGASLVINGAERFQTMDGFGVSVNSGSWNDGELIPALDLLLDQNGSTLWRVIVENTDWEAVNDNADPAVFDWTVYNALYSTPQFEELWSTMRYLNQRGITRNLVLTFMGPGPAWMGAGAMLPGAEDEWVEMVASAAYYARNTRGLQFGMFSPNNEPDWDGIEGIRMDQFQWPRVMNKLAVRLDAIGLGDLRLVGPDTAAIASGVNGYLPQMWNYPALMAKTDRYAFHNYAGDTANAAAVIRNSPYPTRGFWITEYSNLWDGLAHLVQGPSALLVWDAFDSVYNHAILAGRGTSPPNDAGNGPALLEYQNGIYVPRRAFYEASHLFKFVPPGSVRVAATHTRADVAVVAFHDPQTGRVTIVGRNSGGNTVSFSAALLNLPLAAAFEYYVTDLSVNMQRRPDVAITGGVAAFTIPPFSVFTLSSAAIPPPAAAGAAAGGQSIAGVR